MPPNMLEKELQIKQLYKFIHELKELDRALILLYLEEKNYKESFKRVKDMLRSRFAFYWFR